MRSLGKLVLALALSLLMTSVVNADAQVWWTSPDPGVISGGNPGEMLVIEKPADPGRYEFHIDMWVSVDANISGWNANLYRFGDTTITVKPESPDYFIGPAIWNVVVDPGVGFNNGIFLAERVGKAQFFTEPPFMPGDSPGLFWSMTISINKTDPTPGAVHDIYQGVGANLWAPSTTNIAHGPNAPVPGNAAVVPVPGQDLPVIRIVNVPEPGTLALLSLGVLGLIRRRR